MKRNTGWKILVAGICLALGGQAALAAGNPEEGKKKFFTCAGCHGIEGYSNAFPTYPVPRIGGQHAEAVLAALKSYQEGARKHGSMQGNANGWSGADLDDIAAYVSQKRVTNEANPITGNPAKGKEKAATCSGCHGEDGNGVDPNLPKLARQYEGYLVKALKDYKKGARKNPIMNSMAESLSEEDMKDIAAYYASQKQGLSTILE